MEIVVYLTTVIVFLMWLYRAHENLFAFGVRKNQLQYSSGWAVGSFFVPFVTLVIPYRAIKELWIKSVPNASSMFSDLSPPWFFPLWWGFWLLSNFLSQAYFRLSWQEKTSSESLAILGMVSALLDVIAAILAIVVVREIERRQSETSRFISVPTFPQPPGPPPFSVPSGPVSSGGNS